ncbi:glucose 1-dehydrogenase [Stutzerimonas chloritidismutans]|nr:glucose 1-dehydrogenase [Stutzerimonas chloritidismutans]
MDYSKASRLDGKVALVTGGARGLGAEIADALLQMGASVMISDVLDKVGAATAAHLEAKAPGRITFLHQDVTREAEWEAAVAGTVEYFGGLDVLVNNAGIETAALLADCELADFQRTMSINVDGVFLGIKHGIRAMRPDGVAGKGGSIINLSSVAGLVGMPTLGAYCASKGAVRLLNKAAAVECGKLGYGIRVNSIHPGIIKTAMGINVVRSFARLGMAADEAAADAMVESMHPIGYGQPSDVANAVLFLAGEASRWVTGTEIVTDGGASAC